ncbi:hypothetical protein D3C78_1442720 [compost metagenome]
MGFRTTQAVVVALRHRQVVCHFPQNKGDVVVQSSMVRAVGTVLHFIGAIIGTDGVVTHVTDHHVAHVRDFPGCWVDVVLNAELLIQGGVCHHAEGSQSEVLRGLQIRRVASTHDVDDLLINGVNCGHAGFLGRGKYIVPLCRDLGLASQ